MDETLTLIFAKSVTTQGIITKISAFLSASSSLASLARASSTSADVTEDTVVVEVVVEVVVGIPQLSLAMRNYWFLLWIV